MLSVQAVASCQVKMRDARYEELGGCVCAQAAASAWQQLLIPGCSSHGEVKETEKDFISIKEKIAQWP